MKLPTIPVDDNSAHSLLVLLCASNLLLLILLFIILAPNNIRKPLISISPISAQTPAIDFNLISPRPNSTVSGTTPLVTTLTNGPQITAAQLYVDSKKVQIVNTQRTDRLTLFWDTTKLADGSHNIQITVTQDTGGNSTYFTQLTVKNNVSRTLNQK